MLKKLGKYELVEEVGRGAMGQVYKAYDPSIGRFVALKTITASLVGDAELLERFYREARSAGTLQHPNIVTVYELGIEEDTPFIAMELLEGDTLEKIIARRDPLPLSQKVGFIVSVCRALDYAHKRGVVHRDIKPGNIMLTKDGMVKVVDFGIARLADGSRTQTNMIIGTLGYMSPAQIQGDRADERSDIWALGITFYELLCYRRPFEADNHAALMLNILDASKEPAPLRDRVTDCSPALEALIGKMLQKDIAQRFQTMEEVLFEAEPLWKKLQEASVSGLIAESEELIEAQAFARARDLLRMALQVDSRNERAKDLIENVNIQIRQIKAKSQIKSAMDKAEVLLREGRHPEAQAEAEIALKLDSNFAAAREFLAEVQRSAEQARLVREALQLSREMLAEGSLTQAALEIEKVLSLDSANPRAQELEKQIQDQLQRREARKRLSDFIQRARTYWAEQRLDDCITLLQEAQKEFPADADILQLTETVEHDRREQEKQQKLAEARSLLAEERTDEALAVVENLFSRHPGDQAVQKLRSLARQGMEDRRRRQVFETELKNLQSIMNARGYSEVISRGEKLLRGYPQQAELTDLVNFARAEIAQAEQKRNLDEVLQSISKKLDAGKFRDAIVAAEKALIRLPQDSRLQAILEQARSKQNEKENHELLQRRIGEIRRSINKGQHTAAVNLARETQAKLGPDPQVTQLLRLGEMELAQKREKKEEQDKRVAAAQTQLEQGQFDSATQILRDGIETQILSKKDPRVRQLFSEVENRKAASILPVDDPAKRQSIPRDPAKDYVFQKAPPLQEWTSAQGELPTADSFGETISATVVGGSSADLGRNRPKLSWEIPAVSDDPENKGQQLSLLARVAGVVRERPELAALAGPLKRHRERLSSLVARIARVFRERPIAYTTGVFGLALTIACVFFFVYHRPTEEEIYLVNRAHILEQQKKWPEAFAEYEIVAGRHGALASKAHEHGLELKRLLDQEDLLVKKAEDAKAQGNIPEAKQIYQEVVDLHGDKEQAAFTAIDNLNAAEPLPADVIVSRRSNPKAHPAEVARPSAKQPPEPNTTNCQLIPSDIAIYLGLADQNRARGEYADAERRYGAVLACDPHNERALTGLEKARQAQSVRNQH